MKGQPLDLSNFNPGDLQLFIRNARRVAISKNKQLDTTTFEFFRSDDPFTIIVTKKSSESFQDAFAAAFPAEQRPYARKLWMEAKGIVEKPRKHYRPQYA